MQTPSIENRESIVTIQNLGFCWPRQQHWALEIEELTIYRNEKIFIKGASGSGKSTLLNLLGGVFKPNTGDITVLDTSLNALSGAQRDRFRADNIGFIFQQFNLLPYLSIVDNIIQPCHFSKRRKHNVLKENTTLANEASRLAERLGINNNFLHKRNVADLSVGQQQRVAVARALIGQPALIIADEPTSSLDADSRHNFLELLFEECDKTHSTLIFVSHDQQLATAFDRCLDMKSLNRALTNEPSTYL
ncbi:MAG: ABC transporter ATP-binding protein [Gammaproteobacteria bacterium]|nr:ABC transporter ATP-binding protein [Gammaproteobacteria bacterium]